MGTQTDRRSCLRTVLLFGMTGFLAGFIGPLVLSPDSSLGPIIGILFSGPAGVALGALACIFERLFPRVFTTTVLRGLAGVLAVVTLYYCFPEPKAVDRVIEAEVVGCQSPSALYGESLRKWEAALAHAPGAHPYPGWQAQAWRNVERFDGAAVAVTMRVDRSRIIFSRRRPWDRGVRFAGPWLQSASEERTYFAPASAGSCGDWLRRGRALYWPVRKDSDGPIEPAAVWPPVDAQGFLMLQELGPVPSSIRALLH